MKLLLSFTLLILSGLTLYGQDSNNDAAKNKRMAATSGGWYTGGINTSLISVGQSGVSTLLTATDGQTEYKGNFGFILPLVEEIEPNEAPIAITSTLSIFFEEDEILGLDGFDPDGDDIRFEIVQQPKRVTLTPEDGFPGEYTFIPNANLTPGTGYRDTIRFKVVEVDGEKLESDIAMFPFTFNVEDQEHIISSFTYSNDSETTKSFEIVLTDNRFNSDYQVILTYLPLPVDPETGEGNTVIANVNYLLANLTKENNTLKATITANKSEHPLLFTSPNVLVDVEVDTETGFSDYDVFLMDNETNGTSGGNSRNIEEGVDYTDSDGENVVLEGLSSNDGLFIGFNKKKKTLEKTSVQVKMTALELGNFSLANAEIQISSDPKKGTLSKPVLTKNENKIVQWTALYTPTGENGYEDTFEFTVTSDSRNASVTTTGSVEVVNVNDPPSLSAIPGQKINEEQSTVIDLNFSDADSEVTTIATSSDPSKVAVSIVGNKLTAVPAADFNGKVNVKVTVQEKNTKELYSKFETFEIDVAPVNDAPVVASINNQTVNEDNIFTYNLSATDVDAKVPIFGFSAVPDVQGVADVTINGNLLTVRPKANYNGIINFSVTADDRLGTPTSVSTPKSFSLNIAPVNDAPVSTSTIPAQNILDILPAYVLDMGQYFDDVETADANLTITHNATGSLFTLTTVADKVTVSPIQGQSGTENVTFTVSDGELTTSQTVTFTVQANNTSITSSAVQPITLSEDFTSHIVNLGGIFTDTGDANATFSYAVGGLSNLKSTINGNQLALTTTKDFNGTETVFLIGSANGKSSFTTFNVNVTPVNDAPSLGVVSNTSIQEDTDLSNVFMTFSDIDTDLANLNFTAASSNESLIKSTDIRIVKTDAGVILSATPLTNASGNTDVTISVNDGEFTTTRTFKVTVLSVNDAPTVVSSTISAATEDSPYSQSLAGLFNDVDGDNLTFTLEENPSWLTISNGNLEGTPKNENVGSKKMVVIANDGSRGITRNEISINVINTNDAPVVANQAADITALEDQLLSSRLASNIFNDVDGDNLTLSASFTGADWLSFDPSTRRFIGTPTNDNVGTVNITITATDPSGASVTDNIVLTVVNTNDSPTDVAISGLTIAENSSVGTVLGALSSTDVDAGDVFSYSLVAGTGSTDNALFTINNGNVLINGPIDFESASTLTIRVKTTDKAGASFEKPLTITVTNVNEAPTTLSLSNLIVAENAGSNAEVGALSSVDPDNGDTFTYTLVSGAGDTDNSSFDIQNGKLVAKNSLDFEAKPTYSVRLKTSDAGGLSFENSFNISVSNVNEAPTAINLSNLSIVENSEANTEIGTISSVDPDSGESFTFSLVSGSGSTDNASFEIADGRLKAKNSFNFETKQSYSVRIKTTDSGGLSFENSFTVAVTNANDAPTNISITNSTIDENTALGTVVGSLNSTDEDAGDSFTYTFVSGSNDNSSFTINGNELLTNAEIDYESKSSYTLIISTTDAAGLSFNKVIIINVNNVNELSIAAIEGLNFEEVDIDASATKSFTVRNTGDSRIEVSGITVPEGYSVDKTAFSVAVSGSTEVTVTFNPSEIKTYSGNIVMTSNVGETEISVTGEGTIITAIDDDVIDSDEVSLYPNPAQNIVAIDLSMIPQVRPNLSIIDLNGNTVWKKENVEDKIVEVNVSSYPAGTYLVRVASENGSVMKKLIIVK